MTFQPPPPPPGQPPQGPPPGGYGNEPPQGPPGGYGQPPQGPPPGGYGPPPQGPPPGYGQPPLGGYPPGAQPPPGGFGPPPPQAGYGQPAQGQWGPPPGQQHGRPGAGTSFDPKSVNPLDWGLLAAGPLAFIFSLFSWYTYSLGPYDASLNAWHGFFGWFAVLLALVGSAALALSYFAPQVQLPVPSRLIALGAFALALLCMILAIFATPGPDFSGTGVDEGHGFGYWITFILIAAATVLAFLRFQETGGKLPAGMGRSRLGGGPGSGGSGAGPGGGPGAGTGMAPPPPPGPPHQ